MEIKLFDSELKVMEVLWDLGDASAKTLAEILGKTVGWSKTTSLTPEAIHKLRQMVREMENPV